MSRSEVVNDRELVLAIVQLLQEVSYHSKIEDLAAQVPARLGGGYFGRRNPENVITQVMRILRDKEGVVIGDSVNGFTLVRMDINLADMITELLDEGGQVGVIALAQDLEDWIYGLDMPYDVACERLSFSPMGFAATLISLLASGVVKRDGVMLHSSQSEDMWAEEAEDDLVKYRYRRKDGDAAGFPTDPDSDLVDFLDIYGGEQITAKGVSSVEEVLAFLEGGRQEVVLSLTLDLVDIDVQEDDDESQEAPVERKKKKGKKKKKKKAYKA